MKYQRDNQSKMESDNVVMWAIHKIIISILAASLVIALFFVLVMGLEKQSVVDCSILQKHANEYPNFWVTYSQHKTCQSHGFTFTGTEKAPISTQGVSEDQIEKELWYTSPALSNHKWQSDLD